MTDELTALLSSYTPDPSTVELVRQANLVLLVGISGAGKDTLKHELLKQPGYYNFISHTTRPPRANKGVMEVDGQDYHFISRAKAIDMLRSGDFIEAKQYSSNIYGTTAGGLQPSVDEGLIAINDIEVQGVDEYMSMSSSAVAVFVLPPSFDEWQRRLTSRYDGGTVDPDDIERRLHTAKLEIQMAIDKGYYCFVINDELQHTIHSVGQLASGNYSDDDHKAGLALAYYLLAALSTH